MLSVMSSRRAFIAFGIALLVAGLATPLLALSCDAGCVCPMMKMRTAAPAPSAPGSALAPEMNCCQRLPAPAVSPAPSAVAAAQLAVPVPAEGPDGGESFASFEANIPAPAAQALARAERRHDLGLPVLNSVFLI